MSALTIGIALASAGLSALAYTIWLDMRLGRRARQRGFFMEPDWSGWATLGWKREDRRIARRVRKRHF